MDLVEALALSYYSKPPLIAYTHFWHLNLGRQRIWCSVLLAGDIRSPGFLVLRFFAREVNARAGFLLLLAVTATPLLSAGSVLMTVTHYPCSFGRWRC